MIAIDPAAVRSCGLNCELNQVADRIEHLCGTIDQVEAELRTIMVLVGARSIAELRHAPRRLQSTFLTRPAHHP